nr:EF-hand calcium-binding domain-containing protein 4B-like [Salvelinus alpinus]
MSVFTEASQRTTLTAEDLENVFDSLDTDQNGYLTLEVFSSGFSQFLHGRRISVAEDAASALPTSRKPSEALYQSQWDERLTGGLGAMRRRVTSVCCWESLGASNVFQDPGEVRSLWAS